MMILSKLAHLRLNLHEELLYVSIFTMDMAEEFNNNLGDPEVPLDCVEKVLWDRLVDLALSTLYVVRKVLLKNRILKKIQGRLIIFVVTNFREFCLELTVVWKICGAIGFLLGVISWKVVLAHHLFGHLLLFLGISETIWSFFTILLELPVHHLFKEWLFKFCFFIWI